MLCARELGILSPQEFASRTEKLLRSLQRIPLYRGILPNRQYSTDGLKLVGFGDRQSRHGSGWSAIDVGRLLVWLRIAETWHPELRTDVDRVVSRWKLEKVVRDGELTASQFGKKREVIFQEGRLGYEQYAAAAFTLWGVDASRARTPREIREVQAFGLSLPADSRSHAFLTSDPFVLAAMELGDRSGISAELLKKIFEVQQRRAEETGLLTAVSEDSIDRPPWFVYNTIVFGDALFECVTRDQRSIPMFRSFSTKAAFGWSAVMTGPYAQELEDEARKLADPKRGFYAGRFETGAVNRSLNANTNGVILESLLFRARGRVPFLDVGSSASLHAPRG